MIAADPVAVALDKIVNAARVRPIRSIRDFAEAEIILPGGPFQGERFRVDRQPWSGLWLDEVDSGRWRRFNLTGCSQAGKTLAGSAIPVLWHIFEHRETVIYAAPSLEMAADKWREDLLPVIEASRFRDLLPLSGRGSRGGTPTAIQFRHGPTLRFMTGGGNDKVRAGFAARVVVVTETDGMDEAGSSSREADKISQLEARTFAFGDRGRVYLECTTSTEAGRTWRELKAGTDSRLSLPCPHCQAWVTPEREHLTGWQEAANAQEAADLAALACPACGAAWNETRRFSANRRARIVHKGQEVTGAGVVVGLEPRTPTLGVRFSAVNNCFASMARVAEQEWTAPRQTDADLAEKGLRQFWWTLPTEAEAIILTEMSTVAITARAIGVPRGRVPAGSVRLTIGVDLGKWLCHWVSVAWLADGTPHVVEYGRLEVPSQAMAEEMAILTALRRFRDEVCKIGWPSIAPDVPNVSPALVLVDSGNWESTATTFTRESGPGFLPAKGFGVQQVGRRKTMSDPGYEAVPQPAGHTLVEINADLWKCYVHARLQTPAGQPGGLTLYSATPIEHLSFSKHLTAEKKVEEFIAGRGLVTRWEAVNRNNHWLDALALACAGHGVGVRIIEAAAPPPPPASPPAPPRRRQNDYLGDDVSNWLNR